jgi:predicted dehydrogenase
VIDNVQLNKGSSVAIRLGLAGTGYWAEEIHLPTFASSQGVELAGIWGRNEQRTRTLAATFATTPFSRFEDLAAAVDAVAIAVAPHAQADLALAAARAGKHLFLEKPLATSIEDAARIEQAVDAAGVASVVFFMRRFVPVLEDGITALQGESWQSCRVRMLSATIAPGSPYAESVWRNVGGAALWDIGPHVLSILFPILGAVTSVSATRRDHTISFTTEHAAGASASVELSLHADPKDAAAEFIFHGPRGEAPLPAFVFSRESRREACGRALDALLRNIATGERQHACDAQFGARGVSVLVAAEQSIRTGAPVALG